MEEEILNPGNCPRIANGEDAPDAYDGSACQDCTNWDCPHMPESAQDEFIKGELDSMFPEGDAEEFDITSFGDHD